MHQTKWLAETVVTLTPGPKITIPYNVSLFNKIWYGDASIIDLINQAKRYQIELKEARLNPSRVNTQAELARKLGMSKARLTQIMNLMKLAPEVRGYLKSLDDPELLRYFNEKRLRPITNLKDKKTQLEKLEELIRTIGT